MLVAPEIDTAKPYLIRAMHEWCLEQGMTPYIAVFVDEQVQVPMEFVEENEITLNIGVDATGGLQISNQAIEFSARFAGHPRHVIVPITHVMAIYGRENGQGMAFPITEMIEKNEPPVIEPLVKTPISVPRALTAKPVMTEKKITPLLKRVK